MGASLGFTEIEYISDNADNVPKNNLIETGTFYGRTCVQMAPYFKKIVSMEINIGNHNKAKNACAKFDNIKLIVGDSKHHLGKIVDELKGQGNYYFLDAHGLSGVPLLHEMDTIMSKEEHNKFVIIIDDYRFFRNGVRPPKDWSLISEKKLEDIILKYEFKITNKFESTYSDRLIYVVE